MTAASSVETSVAQQMDPFLPWNQVIFMGVIRDSFAGLHAYIVDVDFGTPILATSGTSTPLSGHGYREFGMYPAGTQVICYRPPGKAMAYILCCAPFQLLDKTFQSPDWLLEASGVGLPNDAVHRLALDLPGQAGLQDLSLGRPYDAIPGDWGLINALGMGLALSPLSVALRASGLASLQCFYLDNLVRMVAYQYQHWTAVEDRWSGEDQGECNDIDRFGLFPWEMKGLAALGTDFTQKTTYPSVAGANQPGQLDAFYEPLKDNQSGIYRLQQFRGFIGDVEQTVVSCPATLSTTPETMDATTTPTQIGLSSTQRHADGLLSFRSVKGIVLEKAITIQVPKQLASPDDPAGDTPANYQFGGQQGSGATHRKDDFAWVDGVTTPAGRGTRLADMHSWLNQAYGPQSFLRHTKDWDFRDTGDKPDPAVFAPMGNTFWGPLPSTKTVQVDAREGHTHTVYLGRSSVTMTDDGSIILEDAAGSQIVMGGGNIQISCQGDLILNPGRSILSMAPKDIILKAGGCAEMSTSSGDLRLKAEGNLHALAGNSGTGGMLLESRGAGSTQNFANVYGTDVISAGVTVLSKTGQVSMYGDGVYIRSLNQSDVAIDADQGLGNYRLFANAAYEQLVDARNVYYGARPLNGLQPQAVEFHNAYSVIFGQTGSIVTMASEIFAPNAEAVFGRTVIVGALFQNNGNTAVGSNWDATTQQNVQSMTKNASTQIKALIAEQVAEVPAFYAAGLPSDPVLIQQLGFSCRTDVQYQMTGFSLYETRWQQAFRHAGAGTPWTETTVKAPDSTATMPFPGYSTWTGTGNAFYTIDPPTGWPWMTDVPTVDPDTYKNSNTPAMATPKALATDYLTNMQTKA